MPPTPSALSRVAARLRRLPREHPVLWQVVLWSLPALVAGLILRALLLSYSPYAYWGSDSRSYFTFATGVLNDFYFSLNEKRRYAYPILLVPITALPGSMLGWLAVLQATLGLLTVLPVAYVVRRVFVCWKWWIVPVTLIYTGLPIFLWYEHEMLAESLFFCAITWSIGGWVAWVKAPAGPRKAMLWWWFFAPLALALLTKPSGRFLLPGIVLGLVSVRACRHLGLRPAVAGIALLGLVASMGDDDQGTWLLYVSAFPFTQIDSPKHADYKREVVDLVEYARADLVRFADDDSEVFQFLRNPKNQDERPLWKELAKDEGRMSAVYKDLALEGIAAEPLAFLSLSFHRILASANPEEFELSRFEADYFSKRFIETLRDRRNSPELFRLAFAYPRGAEHPPESWFTSRIAPKPGAAAADWLVSYGTAYQRAGRLLELTNPTDEDSRPTLWPTAFGWFVVGSALAALVAYFRTLGVWLIVTGAYLVFVFLIGVQHPRYFGAVWPMMIVALPALPDLAARLLIHAKSSRHEAPRAAA